MKHWLPDRSTMQGSRFRRDPSVFRRLTWGNASRSIPRISRDHRQTAACDGMWLHPDAPAQQAAPDRGHTGQGLFSQVVAGARFELA